jgi:predicted metal-binding membrane protein
VTSEKSASMSHARTLAQPRIGRFRWSGLGQNGLVLTILAVAALAWILLALTHPDHAPAGLPESGGPPAVDPTGHAGHGGSVSTEVGAGAVLVRGLFAVVGWTFMVVAMMLPPALPLMQTVRKLVTGRPDARRLTYLSALVFIAVWAVVGVVFVATDLGIRTLWAHNAWASAHPQVVAGAVLIGAGVFQLTPLKDACLRACRSPRSFALAHWRGQRPAPSEVAALTGAYALSCVGCCWALMAICFAVGTAALPTMVVLALLMAAERLVSWGHRLVRPAGLVLIVLGVVTVLAVHPPDFLFL